MYLYIPFTWNFLRSSWVSAHICWLGCVSSIRGVHCFANFVLIEFHLYRLTCKEIWNEGELEGTIPFYNLINTNYLLHTSKRDRSSSPEYHYFCVVILDLFSSIPSSLLDNKHILTFQTVQFWKLNYQLCDKRLQCNRHTQLDNFVFTKQKHSTDGTFPFFEFF
jgi:hypothetical protein